MPGVFSKMLSDGAQAAAASEAARREAKITVARLADAKLTALYQEIDAQAATQAAVLAEVVAREAQRMAALANELGVVDQGARATVGGLARERIAAVGGQLKGIVMRADMGNAQQAWEARERARDQLIAMQRERARLEQRLNAELREVMEDAGNQR